MPAESRDPAKQRDLLAFQYWMLADGQASFTFELRVIVLVVVGCGKENWSSALLLHSQAVPQL
ncbi:MAG: hypothetical protein ACXVZV_04200 [Terriglobales bacterium]